jgi:hypothetical protein
MAFPLLLSRKPDARITVDLGISDLVRFRITALTPFSRAAIHLLIFRPSPDSLPIIQLNHCPIKNLILRFHALLINMAVISRTGCSEYNRYHQDRAKNYQFSLVPIGAYLLSGISIIKGNCAIGDNGEYNDGPCDHKPTTNSPYPKVYCHYPFCKGFICYSCHSSVGWPYKTWYHKSEQMYPKPGTSGGPVGPSTRNPHDTVEVIRQGITEGEEAWRERNSRAFT